VELKQKLRPGTGKEVQSAALSITEAHKKNKDPNPFESQTQARDFCKFVTGSFCLLLFRNYAQRVKRPFISVVYLVPEADSNHPLVTSTIPLFKQRNITFLIRSSQRPTTITVCITSAHSMNVGVHSDDWFNNFLTNDGCWIYDEVIAWASI
jgi:hypothetical protein